MAAPRFEIDDTVVLRGRDSSQPNLLGRVERTYHALDSHEPLEDCLIIAYEQINPDIINQFSTSGRPPKGYIFIEFAHEEAGHALLPEQSVTLLSRALVIGDTVKQDANNAMFGTVTDVRSSYVLAPICLHSNTEANLNMQAFRFSDWMNTLPSRDDPRLAFDSSNFSSLIFVYDVNGEDLKRAEDFQSGDHIVSQDWFGVVEAFDIDIAVLLDNMTVVWVEKPWELEIVVTNPYDKPLVSLPESDDIRRPDILNAHASGVISMQPKRLNRGDAVVTNRKNIERGRWLEGRYDPTIPPQGRILDVRTRRLDISWLVPNAFVDSTHEHMPSNSIRPYENLTSFRNASDLRVRKDLARYDHDRKPSRENTLVNDRNVISTGDVYCPGDRVRFKSGSQNWEDLERRGKNEGGSLGDSGNSLIPRSETFDFDLNEYTVCLGYHHAAVLWQDGTTSTVDSTELSLYSLPESDLCPGDVVIAKEGLKMTGLDTGGTIRTTEFNEMSFFERDHVLEPSKVGVIQSVDPQERLARVRWYANPQIKLGAYGQVLQHAYFGKIGEDIEDVSLYEIMTEPALVRKRGDIVVIPPRNPTRSDALLSYPAVPENVLAAHPPGPTTLSYVRQMSTHVLLALWEIARPFVDTSQLTLPTTPTYDWIGEIVDVGLNGSLTVRLGSLKDCRDVIIPQDDILLIVDESAEYSEPVDENMDFEMNGGEYTASGSDGGSIDLQSDEESAIDEIVEYEGGERLDNESGEDEWSTDEDTPGSGDEMATGDATKGPEDIEMGGTGFDGALAEGVSPEPFRRKRETVSRAAQEADEPVTSELKDGLALLDKARDLLTDDGARRLLEQARDRLTSQPSYGQTQSDLSRQQFPPVDSIQNAEVSTVTQYLQQKTSPASFEALEQLPPLDQYNRGELPTQNPAFLKRIAKEHRILASSLPTGEIYVRTYESRLDLLRCLIIGPSDTPYEHCPFVVDLHLGPGFPKEPPKAHFHSWTSGLGRINPNLYEEGKICLSLLGTWPGQSEQEGWSDKATILQVLVSLQGLVFVSQPFYNEAGFETYGEEKVYNLESLQYSEKAYVMARGFVKHALLKAPSALEDVLAWAYLCSTDDGSSPRLLVKVIQRARLLMERSTGLKQQASDVAGGHAGESNFLIDGVGDSTDSTKTFLKPLSQGALVMLKKTVIALEGILQQYENLTAEK